MNYLEKIRKVIHGERGFGIVELLVSMFVFSIIVTSVGVIFTQILALQRRGAGAQKVQENTLYALELMAREIRVSSITNQDNGNCNAPTLAITHPVNGIVNYSLSGGQIRRTAGGIETFITSKEVNYTRLNFCIFGSTVVGGNGDNQQARVTIITQTSGRYTAPRDTVTFDLQTTVVSRDNALEFTGN